MEEPAKTGMVVLAGAGPGDAGLITVEAQRWLCAADLVVYDRLVGKEVLDQAPAAAQLTYVGKSRNSKQLEQAEINKLLVDSALAGKLVIRLKGGDPFIFGRGGEEATALKAAGIPFRVIPGITAAAGAAAYLGLPLTDRHLAGSVAFVTAEEDPAHEVRGLNWKALAGVDTVVIYMGVKGLAEVAANLVAAGKSSATPVAVVERATLTGQRMITGTLGTIAATAAAAEIQPPAVTIIGQVVRLAEKLNWRGALPLAGQTILVTRAAEQSAELIEETAGSWSRCAVCPQHPDPPPSGFFAAG